MKKIYDVVIAYRCYPKVSKTPFVWSESKLEMITGGLASLSQCLGGLKAKFFIIDDGCPQNWEDQIVSTIKGFDFEYHRTEKIGNFGTFQKQLSLLLNQNDSEFVYFAEDDYLYSDNGFSEGIDLLKKGNVDFVSFFDHRGYYTAKHHAVPHKYILDDASLRVWKTMPSTCMTFLTKKKTLSETSSYFLKYTQGVWDYPLWLGLTKYNLYRIFSIDPTYTTNVFKNIPVPATWLHTAMVRIRCRRQILFGKKYFLYIPVPSICTHLESEDKAPLVSWDLYYK